MLKSALTPHANEINRRIREVGVEWHECAFCGRDWPFPKGLFDNAGIAAEREWKCTVCANASR